MAAHQVRPPYPAVPALDLAACLPSCVRAQVQVDRPRRHRLPSKRDSQIAKQAGLSLANTLGQPKLAHLGVDACKEAINFADDVYLDWKK